MATDRVEDHWLVKRMGEWLEEMDDPATQGCKLLTQAEIGLIRGTLNDAVRENERYREALDDLTAMRDEWLGSYVSRREHDQESRSTLYADAAYSVLDKAVQKFQPPDHDEGERGS